MAFSVNTNTGASIALQNLSSTNRSLAEVQNRVNTGLRVTSAKDDSASFSIAQGLRGDVAGLSAVQTSLNRAKSSLDVAVQAGESISDLLNRAREIAVASSDSGLDATSRSALNNDFKSIVSQIGSVVSQAEFNGTNLIKASPDSISAITAVRQNSTVDRISLSGVNLNANSTSATLSVGAGNVAVTSGQSLNSLLSGNNGGVVAKEIEDAVGLAANGLAVDADSGRFTLTLTAGNNFTAATGVVAITVGTQAFNFTASPNLSNGTTLSLTAEDFKAASNGNIVGEALSKNLSTVDLTKFSDRASAIAVVDNFRTNVNSTLATFGSTSRQIDIQQQFATKLTDSINSGIGNLVDADLAKESARLQALQVKQQLGLQALSIANQAPQSVVSLFR